MLEPINMQPSNTKEEVPALPIVLHHQTENMTLPKTIEEVHTLIIANLKEEHVLKSNSHLEDPVMRKQ